MPQAQVCEGNRSLESSGKPDAWKLARPVWGWGRGATPRPTPLFYRGVGLALLNRAFGKNRYLFGARIGWGLIIVSVLFGLVHGVGLTDQLKLEIDLSGVLLTAGAGFLLGWLRERSGSLVLPIAAHNLGNTATRVAEWIA